jgi:prepilin-type N-terminal cleavage/methylation domain-containing protein
MTRTSRQGGFTLIEALVVVTVLALLATKGVPALSSYMSNSRLRETANVVVTTAALARNEAIKRNATVRLSSDGSTLTMTQGSGVTLTTIQTVPITPGSRVAEFTAAFDSLGRLTPFGTEVQAAVDPGSDLACTDEILCPVVRIEAGGVVSLCRTGSCS